MANAELRNDEYLLMLGSNHRRAAALRLAIARLSQRFDVRACSGAKRTRDGVGPHYLNAALRVGVSTALSAAFDADALKRELRVIEAEAGRVRGGKLCVLDIDLVGKCAGSVLVEVYKPDDLRRDYVPALLRAVRIELA